jgi:uncharacterized protein YjbJ (UPF0337 family)
MDKDVIKGKGKDIAGRVERQVGEWTDREDLQVKGAGKQVEGKVQKAVGKVKDAGRDMMDNMKDRDRDRDINKDRDIKKDRDAA